MCGVLLFLLLLLLFLVLFLLLFIFIVILMLFLFYYYLFSLNLDWTILKYRKILFKGWTGTTSDPLNFYFILFMILFYILLYLHCVYGLNYFQAGKKNFQRRDLGLPVTHLMLLKVLLLLEILLPMWLYL